MCGCVPRHFARYKPWARKIVGIEQRFIDEWRSDLAESPWPQRFSEQQSSWRNYLYRWMRWQKAPGEYLSTP